MQKIIAALKSRKMKINGKSLIFYFILYNISVILCICENFFIFKTDIW